MHTIYSDDSNKEDLLSYSMIMANRFEYPVAYYDVFDILTSLPQIDHCKCFDYDCKENRFYNLDEKSKNIAMEYFINAVNKGDEYASNELLDKFNKDKEYPIKEFYTDIALLEKAKENLKNNK